MASRIARSSLRACGAFAACHDVAEGRQWNRDGKRAGSDRSAPDLTAPETVVCSSSASAATASRFRHRTRLETASRCESTQSDNSVSHTEYPSLPRIAAGQTDPRRPCEVARRISPKRRCPSYQLPPRVKRSKGVAVQAPAHGLQGAGHAGPQSSQRNRPPALVRPVGGSCVRARLDPLSSLPSRLPRLRAQHFPVWPPPGCAKRLSTPPLRLGGP